MIADKNFRLESKLFMHLEPDIYVNDQSSYIMTSVFLVEILNFVSFSLKYSLI